MAILSRNSLDERLLFPVKSIAVKTGWPSNGVEGVAQAQSASSKEGRILRKARKIPATTVYAMKDGPDPFAE